MHRDSPTSPSDDQIARMLRALPQPEPPATLHTRVTEAIHAEQRRRERRRYLFALAAVLQLLLLAICERAIR